MSNIDSIIALSYTVMVKCGGRTFRQRKKRKRRVNHLSGDEPDGCLSCVWLMQKWICSLGFDARACHVTARNFAGKFL